MMNPHRSASASQAGFTLVEMLITLAITAMILVAVLFTFDFSSRVARAQTYVSDMQQSLRIAQDDVVRLVRMAGRGSLPFPAPQPLAVPGPLPLAKELQGLALGVSNDVPNNKQMLAGDNATRILPGTDILTVRGIFGPIYQVNFAGSATFDGNPDNPSGGTLTITDPSPGGAAQDLTAIKNAITSGTPEAILLAAAVDDNIRAVVELVPSGSSIGTNQVVIRFLITGGTRTTDYLKLSTGGTFQKEVKNIAYAGILEEHRYYVREEYAIAGDTTSDLTPKLARARFYPGTSTPYKGDASNARLDLADNILDFQVALGFDSSNGGSRQDDLDNVGTDDEILETANGLNDDWLFNNTADDPTAVVWIGAPGVPPPAIQYVRVTTLARSDRHDPAYQAPLLQNPLSSPQYQAPVLAGGRLEDHSYAQNDPLNSYRSRMYRWQTLRTMIDLRNL